MSWYAGERSLVEKERRWCFKDGGSHKEGELGLVEVMDVGAKDPREAVLAQGINLVVNVDGRRPLDRLDRILRRHAEEHSGEDPKGKRMTRGDFHEPTLSDPANGIQPPLVEKGQDLICREWLDIDRRCQFEAVPADWNPGGGETRATPRRTLSTIRAM